MSLLKDDKLAAFFQYFGLLVFTYTLLKNGARLFNNIGTFFFGTGFVNLKKYGSWAVVTGCTDGIGKAYAEILAKQGLNVVLISRTLSKLEELAKQLQDKYSVQTKVIAVDFTEPNSIYSEIKSQISCLDVAILVNNVGMGYKYPEFFGKFAESEKDVNEMINCNVMPVTKMCTIVLPGMVSRKGGVIVNNASATGRVPTPLYAVYSATKAYVDFFSQSVNLEYKSKGIIVQSLCPYFVSTKLSAVRKSFTRPSPSEYASSAIKTIGSQPVTNGCLIHNIQGWIIENIIPRFILDKYSLNMLLEIRGKALAKLARKQDEGTAKNE